MYVAPAAAVLSIAASAAASYTIGTVAGSDWAGDGGPATSALLLQPEGIVTDASGNLYIADAGDHRVRRVDTAGTITTVAGTGTAGFSGDGGPAAKAQISSPYGLALDSQGNLYIADLGNARVRRIGADGTISTVAGGGSLPAGGVNDGAQATALALAAPRNLAFDSSRNLYISDFGGSRVYELSASGALTTAAGTGKPGAAGDNGPAIQAQLNAPAGLAFDAQGALYIADSGNHLIRRVKLGVIISIARSASPTGLTFDSSDNLYIADASAGQITEITSLGAMPSSAPMEITLAAVDVSFKSGAGLYASTARQVFLLNPGHAAVAAAGGGSAAYGDSGPATQARLNHPAGVSTDAAGNLYIADRDNNRIRRAGADGTIVTVAGTGVAGNSGDGGLATQAELNAPSSVAVDASGDLYIADTGNARVRKVDSSGRIFAATNMGLLSPASVAVDASGTLYIADAAAGKILTAGANGVPATLVSGLSSPYGLALDAQGDLYYSEAGAARVSRRSPDGSVTVIGSGWGVPRGLAVDAGGNVYVADSGLQQVLEADSMGNVTVVAGTGVTGFSGDGGAAAAAQLDFPWDVALGANNSILIADLENNRVRAVTASAAQTQSTSAPPEAGNVTVVNAASLAPGPVAPGMLLLISGTGIAPPQIPDTQVAFGPNPARILSADANGILVLAPAAIAGSGSVWIEVLYQNAVVATIPAAVADAAPALFADPAGQAEADNQDGSLNSQTNPAARGSIISLYGTGLGISNDPVTVTFDGFPAQTLYAGPVAGYPGLFQINAQVPSGYLPTGDLPVIVTVGSSPTQPGVMFWVD